MKSGLSLAVKEGNYLKFNEIAKFESNIRFIIQRDGLLHMACRYGHINIVEELIMVGAQFDQRFGTSMRLPIHEAVSLGNEDLVTIVAEKSRDFIDTKDENGLTAAHICAMNGEIGCLKILVSYGAIVTTRDNGGMQLLHWAAKRNHESVILYIFESDVDMNVPCHDGRRATHYAAMNNSLRALQCLIKCHADIGLGDEHKATPMHLAAKHGSLECLRYLASLHVPVTVRQFDGKTPAHLAALSGSCECLHWLLENGADITALDEDQNTVGHLACRSGMGEVMFCYLRHQGPSDNRNSLGEDMYQIARRYGHPVKFESAKKAEIVCPLCQLENNKNEWDQLHAPPAVVRAINNSQHSLFQSPLGRYSKDVRHHQGVFRDKRTEADRRNLETINIGKEVVRKNGVTGKKESCGPGYRDLVTRYYGDFIDQR